MSELTAFLQKQKASISINPPDVATRQAWLLKLDQTIASREDDLLCALQTDLGKPEIEAYASEIAFVRGEIRHARRHLARWTRSRTVSTPLLLQPGRSRITPRPYGQCLIMAPWNYPFQLLFAPLVGALAAGNRVVLKPSELAPNTTTLCEQITNEAFDPLHVGCITGDEHTAQQILAHPFDFIFFTGSTTIGKTVMQAAARNLTPVALELGGKCPCIVNADANLDVAARRIAWGKFLNAGQTCLAPDHLLVHQDIAAPLTQALIETLQVFYGSDPEQSSDYGRIIHERHWRRLKELLAYGRVLHGGRSDAASRYIEPTLLDQVQPDSSLDRDEIFGPLLPIYSFSNEQEWQTHLRRLTSPLAVYCFGQDLKTCRRQANELVSGSLCVNDTVRQIANRYLPFGGIGPSGIGRYHGKASFDCFSTTRSELYRGTAIDPRAMYPPYSIPTGMFRTLMRWLG